MSEFNDRAGGPILQHKPVHGGWNQGAYGAGVVITYTDGRPVTGWMRCQCGWQVDGETREAAERAHADHVAEWGVPLMPDCHVVPGQGCRNFRPDHRRDAHPTETFIEVRVADSHDGTWEARGYSINVASGRDYPLNAEYFPSQDEALVYADACNRGYLTLGAMACVHEWRLQQARAHPSGAAGGSARDTRPCGCPAPVSQCLGHRYTSTTGER